MMLADVDDLAAYMQRTFTPHEETTVELALESASALVEGYLGRRLSLTEGATWTARSPGRLVFLPSPPISNVTVTVDGHELEGVAYDPDTGVVELPACTGTVEIVYDSGTDDVPAAARAVVLAVAARLVTNADGVTQKSIGDVTISYGRAQAGPGLTEWEQAALGPLRFPSVQ